MAGQSRMLGRLGWFGQCACCNGPRDKRQMRRLERRQWERQGHAVGRPCRCHAANSTFDEPWCLMCDGAYVDLCTWCLEGQDAYADA